MALPSIPSYPMPVADELPAGRAGWRFEPDRAALLVHDMQRYFLRPYPPGQPHADLLANVARLRRFADAAGMPVVYTAQPGDQRPADRGLLTDLWGTGLSSAPSDVDIVAELAPRPGEAVLTKWRYSAFVRTGLRDLLASHRRTQLVVCGVYAHIGVLATACDAFMHDIAPFVVADAIADFSAADHHRALRQAGVCAVVTGTDQLCTAAQPA